MNPSGQTANAATLVGEVAHKPLCKSSSASVGLGVREPRTFKTGPMGEVEKFALVGAEVNYRSCTVLGSRTV
jgi:hypothetical protein